MTLLPFTQFVNVLAITFVVLLLVIACLVFPAVDFTPVYGPDDAGLQTWTIILGVVSLVLILVVLSMRRLLSRIVKLDYTMLFASQALRAAMLGLIGLIGFVLVLLGAAAWVAGCFFAVSAVGFLLNYPVRSRWEKRLDDDPSRPALAASMRNSKITL